VPGFDGYQILMNYCIKDKKSPETHLVLSQMWDALHWNSYQFAGSAKEGLIVSYNFSP